MEDRKFKKMQKWKTIEGRLIPNTKRTGSIYSFVLFHHCNNLIEL